MLYEKQSLLARAARKHNQAMLSHALIQELLSSPPADLASKVAATIGRGLVPAKDVAEACGVTVQAINGWKANGRVGKQHIKTLARLTGLPISWWLPGDDVEEDTGNAGPSAPWPFSSIERESIESLPPERLKHLEGVMLFALQGYAGGVTTISVPAKPAALPAPGARGSVVDMDSAEDAFPMRIAGLPPPPWEGGETTKHAERKHRGLRISQAVDVGHVEDSGYSANDHEFLPVPELDVRLAAGQLGIENYQETEIGQILLRRSFLESFKRPIERMKIGYGDGHSMEPIIRHRNPMLMYIHPVELHEIDPRFVYAINHGGKMIVKCLARDWDGTWLAKSINPAYEPFPLALDDGRDVRIIGTILWSPYDLRNGVDERLL